MVCWRGRRGQSISRRLPANLEGSDRLDGFVVRVEGVGVICDRASVSYRRTAVSGCRNYVCHVKTKPFYSSSRWLPRKLQRLICGLVFKRSRDLCSARCATPGLGSLCSLS